MGAARQSGRLKINMAGAERQGNRMEEIHYTDSIEGIDWEAVKRVLEEDDFDNGRSPAQYELSARNSAVNLFAWARSNDGDRLVGTVRVLSDGVCNAYMVDVWTHTAFRRKGIARKMIDLATGKLPGQHLYLFTDDQVEFYEAIGFRPRGVGLEKPIGRWLVNTWE
jgi:ribosomal protein S18 acetylase RimI-like enzyme